MTWTHLREAAGPHDVLSMGQPGIMWPCMLFQKNTGKLPGKQNAGRCMGRSRLIFWFPGPRRRCSGLSRANM
jgi:hypothetical protein